MGSKKVKKFRQFLCGIWTRHKHEIVRSNGFGGCWSECAKCGKTLDVWGKWRWA